MVHLARSAATLLLAAPLADALSATPQYSRRHPHHARRQSAAVIMQTLQDDKPKISSALPSGLSAQMADVRAQLEADEQASAMMAALRGSNINDDDNAASGTTMQVVEMRRGEGDDTLPLVYDPEGLAAYFAKRPGAVITRVAQVATTSAGWVASVALDALKGELTSGSPAEVAAVGRLRSVLVSLGPFFIKLGQALSIRPDILSPQAMVQLQQLCDKVPPFDSNLAMATIREDLNCDDVRAHTHATTTHPTHLIHTTHTHHASPSHRCQRSSPRLPPSPSPPPRWVRSTKRRSATRATRSPSRCSVPLSSRPSRSTSTWRVCSVYYCGRRPSRSGLMWLGCSMSSRPTFIRSWIMSWSARMASVWRR